MCDGPASTDTSHGGPRDSVAHSPGYAEHAGARARDGSAANGAQRGASCVMCPEDETSAAVESRRHSMAYAGRQRYNIVDPSLVDLDDADVARFEGGHRTTLQADRLPDLRLGVSGLCKYGDPVSETAARCAVQRAASRVGSDAPGNPADCKQLYVEATNCSAGEAVCASECDALRYARIEQLQLLKMKLQTLKHMQLFMSQSTCDASSEATKACMNANTGNQLLLDDYSHHQQ